MLYNTLTTYDWSSLYNETSVDAAVARLIVTVTQAILKAVRTVSLKKSKFPVWFSENIKYYIKKKRITSLGVLRIVGLNTVMTNFLHIVGLLKQP